MKAAVLYGPRDLRVESTREPRLEPGEAIVRVASAGLCGTDYSIFTGDRPVDYPRVMGHELVGRVDAEATPAPPAGALAETARRFSGREGVDLVVETAGPADAVTHALDLVRPGGRVVVTGLPHESTPVPFFSVVRREITITGSMIYQDEFGEALRLVASGAVRTRPLITHRFGLDRIGDAFAAHAEPASIKVALDL